ncbi:MAG: cytochrome c [Chitinophaga sp.]|uniref:c-type cytochrome n=1 Tax=Chitinophaga sp. TaxID=1869181 RepID=UPI001B20CE22|nr:cytochrome c [Chitinophaga sp.]MBO9731245.1 cytochrome c [Chitinophaga sp.]
MTKYLLYCLLLLGCMACNNRSEVPSSHTHLLPSQFFNIDTRTDTVLKTTKGASIYIKAGAINTTTGHTVALEVKEAYTIADIVRAGLYTRSNGQPLSSGGMIYIAPINKLDAAVVKPIGVKLPAPFITKGMQLFKGEYTKDSSINWTDPQDLVPDEETALLSAGQTIFQQNCSPCHAIDKRLTGPALLHTTARHSFQWLEDYIVNNAAVMARGDCYANQLFEEYNKVAMTLYPGLKGAPMHELLAYIENESKRIDLAGYERAGHAVDSCAAYLRVLKKLQHQKDSLLLDNGKSVTVQNRDTLPLENGPGFKVRPAESVTYNSYYNFEINTFGWFNIDLLLDGKPEYVKSMLTVRITGTITENTKVFMVIPQDKVYLFGVLHEANNNEYYFLTPDGQIPLPQRRKAYVIAADESEDALLFGTTVFETSLSQQVNVTLAPSDKDAFNRFTQQLEGTGFSLKAVDTKNAKDIRGLDSLLNAAAALKPVGVDCGCGGDTARWPDTPAPAPGK